MFTRHRAEFFSPKLNMELTQYATNEQISKINKRKCILPENVHQKTGIPFVSHTVSLTLKTWGLQIVLVRLHNCNSSKDSTLL